MKRNIITGFLFFLIITGCANESGESKKALDATTKSATALDLVPEVKGFDSLQVLYYNNPDGDSLRYTRFFTYISSKDSALINAVLNNLRQPFQEHAQVQPCRSEGKIYLYKGTNPVKTLYFSTRCNTCCHLYYIENGMFYYMDISPGAAELLNAYKASAIKPEEGNGTPHQ